MRLLPYSLQHRFLMGLVLMLLVIGLFFTMLLRQHMRELFLSEAHSKADLMVGYVESIQHYVRDVLRPVTSDLIEPNRFIIESMSSSYVSRRILSDLDIDDKDFTYRRVAKNARNPDYEMNDGERGLLEQFVKDPLAERKEMIVREGKGERLVIARPIFFTESCLRCHGVPEDAPAVMVDMYGRDRGFHRQASELAGLDIISVSMEGATGAIRKSITLFSVFFVSGMLVLFLAIQGFFNRLVVHNLRRVAQILQQTFSKEEDREILNPLSKETEIEGMISSIGTVAAYLGDARQQLGDYARNLEAKVTDRTEDLAKILRARSADVRIFMRLLSDLNTSKDKQTLLRTTLSLIGRHFGASSVRYVCGLSGIDYIEWSATPQTETAHSREDLFNQFRLDEPFMGKDIWYLPVQASGQTRGMLGLYWTNEGHPKKDTPRGGNEADFPFVMSLAKQLGIALDNMDALDAILRQNSLLDSLVEGVNDPLILVEPDLTPILSNTPANELAKELARQLPRELSGELPGELSGKLPGNSPDELPGESPAESSGEEVNKQPKRLPGGLPSVLPGTLPDELTGQETSRQEGAPQEASRQSTSRHDASPQEALRTLLHIIGVHAGVQSGMPPKTDAGMNPALDRGMTPDVNSSIDLGMAPEMGPAIAPEMAPAVNSGMLSEGASSGQHEVTLSCGRSFMVSKHPLSPRGRGSLQTVIHLRETTEEKRILRHLRQSEKLTAVGQLAAGLAHEINNPLGVIRCYTELLHASAVDGQAISDLEIILRHVEQAQVVVSDMLNFSRQHKPEPGPCNVAELVHNLAEIYKPHLQSAQIAFLCNAPSAISELYTDQSILEQIIVNLIRNALDAITSVYPSGGGILILSVQENQDGAITVSVIDNGPGVKEEMLAKIFEPFFSTKEPGKGTGLGLSIAFGMANDLGGHLDVESPVNKSTETGTAFHVTIPNKPAGRV